MNEIGLSPMELLKLQGYPEEAKRCFLKVKQAQVQGQGQNQIQSQGRRNVLEKMSEWDVALLNLKHLSMSNVDISQVMKNEVESREIKLEIKSKSSMLKLDQVAKLSTSNDGVYKMDATTDVMINFGMNFIPTSLPTSTTLSWHDSREGSDSFTFHSESSDLICNKNNSTELVDLCLADDLLSIKDSIHDGNDEELRDTTSSSEVSKIEVQDNIQIPLETKSNSSEFVSAASSIYIPDENSVYYDNEEGNDENSVACFRTACQSIYSVCNDDNISILYRTANQSLYSVGKEDTASTIFRSARQSIYDVNKQYDESVQIIQSIAMTRCIAEVIKSDGTSLISSEEEDNDELERFLDQPLSINVMASSDIINLSLEPTLNNEFSTELQISLESIDTESSDDEQRILGLINPRLVYESSDDESNLGNNLEDLSGLEPIKEEPTLESLLKDSVTSSSILEPTSSFEFNHTPHSQLTFLQETIKQSPQLEPSSILDYETCSTSKNQDIINNNSDNTIKYRPRFKPYAGLSPINGYTMSPSLSQPSTDSLEANVTKTSPISQPNLVTDVTLHGINRKKTSITESESNSSSSNSTRHNSPNSKLQLAYQNNPKPYHHLRRTYSERALKHSPILEEVENFPEDLIPYPIKNELSAPSTAMVSMTTSLDAALEGLNAIKPRRSHSMLQSTFQRKMKQFNLLNQKLNSNTKPPLLQRLKHLVTGRPNQMMPRLFQFDNQHGSYLIAIGSPISATCLSTRHTYVLECEDVIYIWFGNNASEGQQREASWFAGNLSSNYTKIPIRPTIKMEFEGCEQLEFMTLFSDWHLAEELQSYLTELATRKIPGQEILCEAYHHPPSEPSFNLEDTFFISLKVWVMKSDQDHLEIPNDEHGIFYSKETYVMLYHYQDAQREQHHIIFYWIGRDSLRAKEPILPPSKVNLDGHNKATVIYILQGREPNAFISLFHISFIIKWGYRLNPYYQHGINDRVMYSVRSIYNKKVTGQQTTLATKYLCSGRSFIIISKTDIFVWHGVGSYLSERKEALKIATRLATSHHTIMEVQEKLEPKRFWQALGNDRQGYADNLGWSRKPFLLNSYKPRLFHIITQPTVHVREISNFHQKDLKSNEIYLLDTYFDCYIWGQFDGKLPPSPVITSIYLTLEYTRLVTTYNPRPFQLVPSVVVCHYEPNEFIAAFPNWSKQSLTSPVLKRPPILQKFNSVIPVTHLLSQWRTSPTLTPQRHSPRSQLPMF